MKLLFIILIALVSVSMCSQPEVVYTEEQAKDACVDLCRAAFDSGRYLEIGPCLSDSTNDWDPNWKITDWVCDVAHSPRQPLDGLKENQCSAYNDGKANHFVEVFPNCTVIRAV